MQIQKDVEAMLAKTDPPAVARIRGVELVAASGPPTSPQWTLLVRVSFARENGPPTPFENRETTLTYVQKKASWSLVKSTPLVPRVHPVGAPLIPDPDLQAEVRKRLGGKTAGGVTFGAVKIYGSSTEPFDRALIPEGTPSLPVRAAIQYDTSDGARHSDTFDLLYLKRENVWQLAAARLVGDELLKQARRAPEPPPPPAMDIYRRIAKENSTLGHPIAEFTAHGEPTIQWEDSFKKVVFSQPATLKLSDEKKGLFGKKVEARWICEFKVLAKRYLDSEKWVGQLDCNGEGCRVTSRLCKALW
jgi:hypothetical protein